MLKLPNSGFAAAKLGFGSCQTGFWPGRGFALPGMPRIATALTISPKHHDLEGPGGSNLKHLEEVFALPRQPDCLGLKQYDKI